MFVRRIILDVEGQNIKLTESQKQTPNILDGSQTGIQQYSSQCDNKFKRWNTKHQHKTQNGFFWVRLRRKVMVCGLLPGRSLAPKAPRALGTAGRIDSNENRQLCYSQFHKCYEQLIIILQFQYKLHDEYINNQKEALQLNSYSCHSKML
ncbi:Hypothetical_protein [Hexamita inflata]|uniref:Hypothetical_protein n=1 Tax=Hexamita inflata TaxID=28002 RepID=A0AA86U2C0_9EUKA|nr:Hypothetical protein HINF_LOCUS27057 [Hexamita inflata]CAI9939415.1 Hypothetical protein HINF_LOCUS27060 [Hexamita inflata]